MNMNMASMGVSLPGCKKGRCRRHDTPHKEKNADARLPGAPGLHRFYEDQSERQGREADIEVNHRQLQQPAATLEKQRIPTRFRDDESERG
jgi:hypothetical protein